MLALFSSLVCCAVSAPSEGIAVIRRKNYLLDGFCLFDRKVPKVPEISSPSIHNVDDEQFSDCLKRKIICRPSFFYNFFINQYQSKKNNYYSLMDSVLEDAKKKSGSSVESAYRKRNLLWTQKGIQSLKTLRPTQSPGTSSLPPTNCYLNFKEKKRLFALKKAKEFKRKRVGRYSRKGHLFGKARDRTKQISFSGPVRGLPKVARSGYLAEEKRRDPRFHKPGSFIEYKKNKETHEDSGLTNFPRGRKWNAEKQNRVSYNLPDYRHSPSFASRENARSAGGNNLVNSNFDDDVGNFLHTNINNRFRQGSRTKKRTKLRGFRSQLKALPLMKNYISALNQLVYDSGVKENDKLNFEDYFEIGTTESNSFNDFEDIEYGRNLNEERGNNYENEVDLSESDPETEARVRLLTKNQDYFSGLSEDFSTAEESKEYATPDVTDENHFLAYTKANEKIADEDFDFPDYDEIYDTTADVPSRVYIPLNIHTSRKHKLWKNEKGYSKIRQFRRGDVSRSIPLNVKRSLLLRKMERKKKCCGSRYPNTCRTPHRCWKSAPLLCIPYIRKGQDDLLKYLIQIMQKMLGKPYPQKIDIFDNIKYKPYVKKPPTGSCEDIMPHEPDDDDENPDDNCTCDSNKGKTTSETCNPCPHPCPKTPKPCPVACPPTPTPCCPSPPPTCPKNSSEPLCPCFPCSLPNLNQIFTETTPCSSDKCFSTLPPFLLAPSSIVQSGAKKGGSASPAKPTNHTASVTPSSSPNSKKTKLGSSNLSNFHESVTIFPPKELSPQFHKDVKQTDSDLLAGSDKFEFDRRLNDKMIPKFVKYQAELKVLNVTESTAQPETAVTLSTSSEPFLFELPELFDNRKRLPDFLKPNNNNSFVRRDLGDVYDYDNGLFYLKSSTDSLKTFNRKFYRVPLRKRRRKKKHYYKLFPTDEGEIYRGSPEVVLRRYDESQIDRPFRARHRPRRPVDPKETSLKRRKREDDYSVDDLADYESYQYDTNRNEKQPFYQVKRNEIYSDVNRLADDYMWTPLKSEMFSELAEVMSETENTTSDAEVISVTSALNVTESSVDLSLTTEGQLETNSVELSTEKSSVATLSEELPTTDSATKSSPETQEPKPISESIQTLVESETVGKTLFYSTGGSKSTKISTEEKLQDVSTYFDAAEEQVPSTLGTASIVKAPKRQTVKPSPKVYTKVYPDPVVINIDRNDTGISTTTDAAPKRSISLKTTAGIATAAPDIRLQLLAVCEGYLEVVKLMKSQNQSLGEDLDSDLSHYCENIISQSFIQQTESSKSKKPGLSLSESGEIEAFQNSPERVEKLSPESTSDNSLRLDGPAFKRELDETTKAERVKTTNDKRGENPVQSPRLNGQKLKKRKRRRKEYQGENQKVSGTDDEFLKKGMTKEQVELLRLLKKRKRELLNWLFNSKEDQIQPEVEETEYFSDSDASLGDSLNFRNGSGTVRPRGAKSSRTTAKVAPAFTNDSIFPVYAKQYGYDKGGELRQVEVLWRKLNEKTHEKRVFKNLSVLALVLTSTVSPEIRNESEKLGHLHRHANEKKSESRSKNEIKVGLGTEEPEDAKRSTVAENTSAPATTSSHNNGVVTYVNKPNRSSLIGTVASVTDNITKTTKRPNITRKIADKFNKAEGAVEAYTVEFWNYAAYILPVMVSTLFLFFCACFALRILRKRKTKKKSKKKKIESTDEEPSTEETDSEPKKKKRDKGKESKKIWHVWKKNSNKPDSDDESNPPEKNKSLLRFLRSKKDDKTEEAFSSVPYSALPESDKPKGDTQSEAAERRELIALLEELKKMEMEQVGEKKEQKSVHVQYMIQDRDESAFERPEVQKGYPFYYKSFRFHEPGSEEYGIYRDAELNELLPCGCNYYNKKRSYCDFKAKEDGCDRLFKIFRDTNLCHHKLASTKKFTDKDRNFIFEKYRRTDANDDTPEMGFPGKVREMTPFNLPARNPNDWTREMEHFNQQIVKKKHVRLKDDGVLCRL